MARGGNSGGKGNQRNYLKESALEEHSGKPDIDLSGFSMSSIRRYFGLKKTEPMNRNCLSCRKSFESDWIGNRVCDGCKNLSSRFGY